MSSSCSESENDISSGDEYVKMGQEPYLFEPEYTEEELNKINEAAEQRLLEIEQNPRGHDTLWCSCNNCIVMPLSTECLCCHEFELLPERLTAGECLSENEDFATVCLNHVVLEIAYVSFMRYKRIRCRAPDTLTNRQSRLMAYRQFVCWVRKGRPMGRKNRVPLPSCVVNKIRTSFPDSNEDYEGFHFYESDI